MFAGQLHLKTRPKACPGNYSICVLDFIRSLHTRVRLTSLVTVTEDLQVSIFDTIMTMITASSGGIQDDGGVIFTSPLASADPGLRLSLSHLGFGGHSPGLSGPRLPQIMQVR